MNEVQERQSITSRRAKLDRKLCIGWTVALVLSLALALDSLLTAPGKDLSVYIYVAQGIPSGDVPYLDRWDNKGPLTYLLTLAGKMMGGAYGVWLLGASFLLGSSWFAFKITREAFGLTAALLATTSFLVCFRIVADGGGLTEHYALLFQLLTIYLFFRLSQGNVKRDIPLCLAIGVLGAATFLLRPNLVGLWLTIGLYVAVQHWILGRRDTLRWMPWFVAGGLAILAVTAISFATFNAWSALWDAVFMYNFTYSDATLSDRLSVLLDLRRTLMMVSLPLAAGWCIGLYYLLSGKARGKCYEDILLLGLILLPVETVLVTTSGYGFNHYYLAVLPAVALVLAFLARFVLNQALVAPVLLATALIIPVVYYNLPDKESVYRGFIRIVDKYTHAEEITSDRYSNVAKRVRQLTDPDDPILVWGNQAQIYLQSKRDAPTRFFTQFPLINRGYADQSIRDEFISGVISNRPIVIVDTGDTRLPPLDRQKRSDWLPKGRRYIEPADYRPFFALVDSEYESVEEVDGFTVYKLVGRK